eukprot:CAMPEP_0197559898 /NCGR_PEP_ID=MMETSP1320-20131121/22112_1 /TAXON_ID=91990 /ORGANISM="Bolidomonas sp., Strain RCC2347" /LENGTH=967 /DNA_ID=CAMNT_0043121397 /DNA_START=114 /DNA_END=3014 /DNA_ORIENTATION=-
MSLRPNAAPVPPTRPSAGNKSRRSTRVSTPHQNGACQESHAAPAPAAARNLAPVRPKSLPGSRRTSSAGVPTKRPGRRRASSVSVRGMASPDLLKGSTPSTCSAGNTPVQQQRRVSIGGPTAGSLSRGGFAMKETSLQPFNEFKGVDAKSIRTTQEQIELKKALLAQKKIDLKQEEEHHTSLHRRLSIDEESNGTESEEEVDESIMDIVTRSSFAHGPDSPQYTAARSIKKSLDKEEKQRAREEMAKKEAGATAPVPPKKGGVSVKNLRHDTIENAEMKHLIHELEEREHQRVLSGESPSFTPEAPSSPSPGGGTVSVRDLRHDTVENAQMKDIIHTLEEREHQRHVEETKGRATKTSTPKETPKVAPKPSTNDATPILFVYVKTVKTDKEWWDASLELEIFPRFEPTKKVCKTVSACSRGEGTFDFHSFVKLDVHQEVDSGRTIVKKSKSADMAGMAVPQLRITAKLGDESKGVATIPLADVSLFKHSDYDENGGGVDIPMSLMKARGELFGKVFVRFMYVAMEDREDKVCRKKAKRMMNQANEARKYSLKVGARVTEPSAVSEVIATPKVDLSLNLGQPPLSSNSLQDLESSSYMIQRQRQVEMERVIERQNLQHQSTMETLNATANLLAQTVAIMGVKAANEVRREEGGVQGGKLGGGAGNWPAEERGDSRVGSRKGSNDSSVGPAPSGSGGLSPTGSDTLPRKKSRMESLSDKSVLVWGVMDVAAWLTSKQVGLAPYAIMFVDQAVDGLALCNLTDSQLNDLGIFNSSHKKKLLLQVARFRAEHRAELEAISAEISAISGDLDDDNDGGVTPSSSSPDATPIRKARKLKEGKEAAVRKPQAGHNRRMTSEFPGQVYSFNSKRVKAKPSRPKSPNRSGGDRTPGDRSPAQRSSGSGATLTPHTLSPAASSSTLSDDEDSQDGIMGRRSSQNASLLTFDNPSRASRVVTEASEDRADTVLYTNMM